MLWYQELRDSRGECNSGVIFFVGGGGWGGGALEGCGTQVVAVAVLRFYMGPLPQTLALTACMALRHVHIPSGRCHCMPWPKLQPLSEEISEKGLEPPIVEFSISIVVCW